MIKPQIVSYYTNFSQQKGCSVLTIELREIGHGSWAHRGFPLAPSQSMDTGILPAVKRDTDDEDIYIRLNRPVVSLAGGSA